MKSYLPRLALCVLAFAAAYTLLLHNSRNSSSSTEQPNSAAPLASTAKHTPAEVAQITVATQKATAAALDPADLFEDWRTRFDQAAAHEREALAAEGQKLAQERRAQLKHWIINDPEAAIAARLPMAQRKGLPTSILDELETVVAGVGFYGVKAVCNHGDGPHEAGSCRIDYEVLVNDQPYQAFIYGSRFEKSTLEEEAIFGIALDGNLALHEAATEVPEWRETVGEVAFAEPTETATEEAAALVEMAGNTFDPATPPTGPQPPSELYNEYTGSRSHQLGPKNMMVMLVRPSDGASFGSGAPTYEKLLADLQDTSHWYYGASYRQTWFGPKQDELGALEQLVVTVELDLPSTIADYRANFALLRSHAKAAVEAQGGEWTSNGPKDPDRFDRWVVMAKNDLTKSTGLAFVGGRFAWTQLSIKGGVARHELGHNWGVYHANLWVGNNGIPRNSSGKWTEYGDGADVMGGGSGTFNPLFLKTLGFLSEEAGDFQVVTTSGNYRVFDHTEPTADNPVSRVRALQIPISGTSSINEYLMLGLRHETGTDGGIRRNDWNRNALEIHANRPTSRTGSHFLDTTPDSFEGNNDRNDGGLVVGRTYSEPANLNGTSLYGELHVTPIARGSEPYQQTTHEFMDVVIHLGDFSANQKPNATIAASSLNVSAGETIQLTAQANDPEKDPLAYSWDFGNGSYSYDNSPTQTVSYASGGFYQITLTVSDMKGGTATATRWINVGNQPVFAPVASGPTVPGLAYRYYESGFSTIPDFDAYRPKKSGIIAAPSLSPKERTDDFALIFEGFLEVPETDVIAFELTANDGANLYISDQLVVNNGGLKNNPARADGSIALEAGKHPFRLEFFHYDKTETLQLQWKLNAVTGNEFATIASTYFSQPDLSAFSAGNITITSPSDGAVLPLNQTALISASVTEPANVERVAFFIGNLKVGEDHDAPFSMSWSGNLPGVQTLTARVYRDNGTVAESPEVTVRFLPDTAPTAISVNFLSKATQAEGTVAGDEPAGIFGSTHWNNLEGFTGSAQNLKNSNAATTATSLSWSGTNTGSFLNGESIADISTPNGRLMRGILGGRKDQSAPAITVSNIPFAQYDVVVYFDQLELRSDHTLNRFILTPQSGNPTYVLAGRNSTNENDDFGDYPNYDTWLGFKEATATSEADAISAQLGNYVVFRNLTESEFTLLGGRFDPAARFAAIAGLQIVEAGQQLSPAQTWRLAFFNTPDNSGDAADTFDFDNDGYSNLLERAFGTSPVDAGSFNHPKIAELAQGAQTYAQISYRRIAGGTGTTGINYTANGIRYRVETTPSLSADWTFGATRVEAMGDPLANGDGTETVTVRSLEPVPSNGFGFMRVMVESNTTE